MGDEIHDPAVVLEAEPPIGIVGLDGRIRTLIANTDLETAVEKRHHLEAFLQGLKAVVGLVEDRTVGPEPNRGAGARCAVSSVGASPVTARRSLSSPPSPNAMAWRLPSRSISTSTRAESDDHRDTHAVEAAGHLVPVATELAAGVQHGEHDLGSGEVFILGVLSDRNTTAVVANLDAAVGKNRDVNTAAVAGHRLVDGVVDNFPNKVVQTRRASRADVHTRAFADGFEAFENSDVLRAVRRRFGGGQRRLLAGRGRSVLRRVAGCSARRHRSLRPSEIPVVASEIQGFALLEAITSRWSRGLNTVPLSYQLHGCDSWQSDPFRNPRTRT